MDRKTKYNYRDIISKNIKHQLTINDMTRRELAEKLKCSVSLVNYWCTGERIPYIEKIYDMAKIFKTDCADLMFSPMDKEERELLASYKKSDNITKEKVKAILLRQNEGI